MKYPVIMQVARYAEQWLLWIIVNVVSVVMWIAYTIIHHYEYWGFSHAEENEMV